MDGVAISIIGRPRPLPGHDTPNPAHNTYTLKCEEPHNLVECAQPVTVHQSCVVLSARNRVGVRGQGEFVDDRRVGVGQGQRREAHAFYEASAVWAEGGSRALVIAMVVVVGDSPTNLIF